MNIPNTSRIASPTHPSPGKCLSGQTDGHQQGLAYLDGLNASMAQPEELNALMLYLRSELLHRAFRLIAVLLGGHNHG